MYTLLTIYSTDHVPGHDPPLYIAVGAYFLTFYSTLRKYISRHLNKTYTYITTIVNYSNRTHTLSVDTINVCMLSHLSLSTCAY